LVFLHERKDTWYFKPSDEKKIFMISINKVYGIHIYFPVTFVIKLNIPTFAFRFTQGRVAERLGRGLQNLVQRFESARDLHISISFRDAFFI
jgi:hypothetical protein